MYVYRVGKCTYINDLSGTGAAIYGGRWNSKGIYMVYTACSISLCMLEALVHINNFNIPDFCRATLEIPDADIATIATKDLPKDWQQTPAPDKLRAIGNKFIKDNKYLALKVPSVIVPEECNYLLNPFHINFGKIKTIEIQTIHFDQRLIS